VFRKTPRGAGVEGERLASIAASIAAILSVEHRIPATQQAHRHATDDRGAEQDQEPVEAVTTSEQKTHDNQDARNDAVVGKLLHDSESGASSRGTIVWASPLRLSL
jgi:hypothetical protein